MEALPNRLGLVHKRVFLRHFHPLDHGSLRQNIVIRICKLEHLIGKALLRALILFQFSYVILVLHKFRQSFRVPSDIVNIRWVLRLPLVE